MKAKKPKVITKKVASSAQVTGKTIPCAIYTRVGTEVSQLQSVADQEQACLKEIQKKSADGWSHSATESDTGYSGANLARPGLRRLLSMITKGKVKVVVVHKLDRLWRGWDTASQLQPIFDQYNVQVLSCGEGHNGPGAHTFMQGLMDACAQYERHIIQERLNKSLHFAAKNGFWKGGRPSLGYKYRNGSKTLDIE